MRKLAEDYDMTAVATIMNTSPVNAAVVRHWKERGAGRKTIAFAATVDHAYAVCSAFLEAGVAAAVVHGEMSNAERKETLAAFETGNTMVIVNVAVLTEGYDFTPMVAAASRRGHAPGDDNEADALAILHWAMEGDL